MLAAVAGMRILISNDDGIYSPGIALLAEVAAEFGSVRVVAPDVERSTCGHSITHNRPLSYRQTTLGGLAAYRVDGTPADCVALGAHHWEQVDLVLSGLNIGLNLGNSIWHSGTLAAAKQACLLGLRGVALSAPASAAPDFAGLKPWIRRAIETVLQAQTPRLVNINFPSQPRGLLWTRASIRQYDGRIVPTTDPLGREMYWFTIRPLEAPEEGTDRWAVERDWISLTPLKLDLTDEGCLGHVRSQLPLDEAHAADPRSSGLGAQSIREEEVASPMEEPST